MLGSVEKPSIREVFQTSTLLNGLGEPELDRLREASRLVCADRGEMIWYSGDETDFFGLVGTGFVKMVKGTAAGTDVTLELMGPGQIFGMMGVIDGKGCPLTAMAVTGVWYARIPKAAFLPIYKSSAEMKDRLIRRLTTRFHDRNDLMARMASGRVDERLAAILFVLAESYGDETDEGMRIRVPLTRQELGEMAGTTTESTIRTLSRWQKEGIVSTEQHFVTIRDEDALQAVLAA
jgi:CRP-like cAMP-binding protein